jgi:HK97 family phage major capsid protein
VPVRTIGGYIPVSRQTLERASYSEGILFEDLVARYYAALDVDCLNGSGASGHMLGLLQTSGVVTSVAGVATLTSIWPKIADVIQQINSNVGGLGYMADKIFMHPRRWGFFEAALDTAGRPVFGINGLPNYAPNAAGEAAGYGPVGRIHGLPVYTDANIPTNFHTDEDPIIVSATRIVHLWERSEDPVTLSFEQQAGTSLQVQLIAYGYAAFTAGRYPAASGYVYGAGLVAPTFGS